MRLVEESSGELCRLAAADTCALDEGEDDLDDDLDLEQERGALRFDDSAVTVRTGAKFFQKLKMSTAGSGSTKVRHRRLSVAPMQCVVA